MIIEFILLAAFALLAVYAYHRRGKSQVAYILIVFLSGMGMLATLAPGATTLLARFVGVGRGTDLVLYLFVIFVMTLLLQYFLWIRDMEIQLTQLARRQALNEARDFSERR
jgi:small membrane protein